MTQIRSQTVREHDVKVPGFYFAVRRVGFELGLTITPQTRGASVALHNGQVRELRRLLNAAIEEEQV